MSTSMDFATPPHSQSHSHTNPNSHSPSRKRKPSATDPTTGRTIKYRSSQACQSCRARKVRCDVTTNGSCCTNCRLDNTECVVVASRRGKSNRARRKSSVPGAEGVGEVKAHGGRDDDVSPNGVGDVGVEMGRERERDRERESNDWGVGRYSSVTVDTPRNIVHGDSSGHVPAVVTFDEDLDKPGQQSGNDTGANGTDGTSAKHYEDLLSPETGAGTGSSTLNQYHSPAKKALFPSFIAPFSGRITNDDLNFLVLKGATTVPEHDLRMEIIRGYLFSVHPFMPMLDYKAFIRAVLDTREEGQISLLLFQAVMFAGVSSLQSHVIHRLGFNSPKHARQVFYDRVKLLYEFDVETDSAAILQATVLMSLWYGKSDDRKHTWHWTGVAYDVARSMGLQREPTAKLGSDKVRRFRRRLWWSLYVRDRLIALGTRRPMRIRDDEFNVAMLTMEDLEIESLEDSHLGQALVPSVEESTSAALMCLQHVKLCGCIGRVVSSQYTVLSGQPDVPPTMMVVPKRDGGNTQELESCEKELEEWFQALGSNVRRTGSYTPQPGRHSLSEVHWATLNLTYLTVCNVLHRGKALLPLAESTEGQELQALSKAKVKDAARGLTKVSQTMLCNDHVRFLGPLGVTALIAAALSHMLDISSGDADVRDASTFRLYQSLQVLQALREIYASADASFSFLTSITRKAGIPIPVQIAAPHADFGTPSSEPTGRQQNDGKPMRGKLTAESPDGRWPVLNEQSNSLSERFPANSYQGTLHPSDGSMQAAQTLLELDGQVLNAGDMMRASSRLGPGTPSGVTFTRPASASRQHTGTGMNTPGAEKRTGQYVDAGFGEGANQGTEGALFDWNNNVDASMDLDSMAFSYDFYSNAFGMFDGDVPRI